jgi:long-chain acyl-CoA synthetase
MTKSMPKSLNEMFGIAVKEFGDREVYRYRRDRRWQGITANEVREQVELLALGLHALGVSKGDRVALLSESRPEWSLTDYAILANGAVNVPIYPTQSLDQVDFILRNSGARVLFVSGARQLKRVRPVLRNMTDEERPQLVVFDSDGSDDVSGGTTLEGLAENGRILLAKSPELLKNLSGGVGLDDLATIIYTSGTTGVPKGVMLTHLNLVSNIIAAGDVFQLQESDTALSFLPLSHVFERTVLYIYLWRGVTVSFARGVETVSEDIKEVKPTVVTAVPRLFEKIYGTINKRVAEAKPLQQKIFQRAIKVGRKYARKIDQRESVPLLLRLEHRLLDRLVFTKWREALGGRLRFFVSGGAALPSDLATIFLGAGIPILQGYGLTETSPVVSFNRPDDNRIGTIGQPIPGVKVRVAEDGELLVQGDCVMRGYYLMPEETSQVIRDETDGVWFHTGDIGTIEKDNFIRITDRKKDLIKTSLGKYIAPQPIENMIRAIPMVEQVIVIGNARKFPVALIVPNFDALTVYARNNGIVSSSPADLVREPAVIEYFKKSVDRVTRDLASHEKIKKIALLEQEFSIEGGELTPTLKVRRKFVEEKHHLTIDALYPKFETDGGV